MAINKSERMLPTFHTYEQSECSVIDIEGAGIINLGDAGTLDVVDTGVCIGVINVGGADVVNVLALGGC